MCEIHKPIDKLFMRLKRVDVNQCFSKCGPWTSWVSMGGEFVRNENSRAPPQTHWIKNSRCWEYGPAI